MASVTLEITEMVESRVVHLAERPISFERFLELTNEDEDVELVDGVMVKRMTAQLDHERLFVWLLFLLHGYVKQRGLGEILGSRFAVEITQFRGRLPDLVFVRRERHEIIQQRAIFGTPDLVIELVSPNDRPSDIMGLESDYRTIGVSEIVFIDRQRQRVRLLRRREDDYEEEELSAGQFRLETVEGFHLEIPWFFDDPLPDELAILNGLLTQNLLQTDEREEEE